MNRTVARLALAPVTLVSVTLAMVTLPGGAATADPPVRPYCSLTGLTTFEWDGGGDGISWSDEDNWVGGTVPGTDDLDDAYVCVPADFATTITLETGDVATVQVFEAPFVELVIEEDAGLFVYGDTPGSTSIIGGSLELRGAMGGPGKVDVNALTIIGEYDNGSILPTGSVLTSDPCAALDDLPPTTCTSAEGRMIHHYASNAYGGFEMLAGYDLVVRGALVPGEVGIGLSPGSRLKFTPDGENPGQMSLHGDADFYPVGAGAPRPVIVNNGIIRKFRFGPLFGEHNVSVVTTAYRGQGEVWVEDGDEFVISDGTTRPAEVEAASKLGSGPCRLVGTECSATTLRQRGKRQAATFEAPASQPASQRALVTVRPRKDLRRPGDLGYPFLVHADELGATRFAPALIELRYDGALLAGRTWADVQVFRQRAAGEPWRRLRPCRANGTPRAGARACVDRRGLAESSHQVPASGGDAILVVRTTVTSRWVGR